MLLHDSPQSLVLTIEGHTERRPDVCSKKKGEDFKRNL